MSSSGSTRRTLQIVSYMAAAAVAGAVLVPLPAAAQSGAPAGVTFTKDVAPIFVRSCVQCHQPNSSAPMSLMTFEDARPWARAIKTRIVARSMPPWHIDRNVGIQKFKDDPSLSDQEIATIAKWVDSGAPKGNPADMPPLPKLTDGSEWAIGKPDLIIRFPTHRVLAAGPDIFPTLYASLGLTEDRYVKAIQTRPADTKSRRALHHSTTSQMPDSATADAAAADDEAGQFVIEYASGKRPEFYPDNSGVLLKAGNKLALATHLHSIGEDTDMVAEMGFLLYPKGYVPKYIRYSTHHGDPAPDANESLDIPAGRMTRVDGYTLHQNPAKLIAWQPHMHIRGKYQCFELIYPSNPSKVMKRETINCANWDYNWHTVYNYADDVAPLVPAGTIVHITTWHDNSAAVKANPDPKNWVGYGQRTIDEMGFSWIGWVDLTQEEYEAEWAARKAKQATSTNQQQQ